jgi:hypothetical protein
MLDRFASELPTTFRSDTMPTRHWRFLVDAPFRHVRKSAQKDSVVVAEQPGSVGVVGEHFAYRMVPDGMAVEQGNHRESRWCKRIEECHAKAVLLCAYRSNDPLQSSEARVRSCTAARWVG